MKQYSEQYMKRYISTVLNKAAMPESAMVSDKIQYFPLEAVKQDISDWSDARLFALDNIVPDWTDLIRVYDDVMVDSHVSGIIRSIKKKIKAKKWYIYNEDGTVDEELTKIFHTSWFKKFIDLVIMADIYPYSVLQLGDWDDGFKNLTEIKREYFIPQYNHVKRSLYISGGKNDRDAFDLSSPELEPYFIVVKSDEELGLLDHVAPLALGKKHMLIYWWRYGEQYGLPFKIGKTEADDNSRKKALENAFKNMGSNMWVVTDLEDQIEFMSASDKSGSINVFKENLDYANNEISKAIAGAVGIFDTQSFVGSAEAGERLFDTIISSYCNNIEDVVNEHLFGKIATTYKDTRFVKKTFGFDYAEHVTFEQKLKALDVLARNFILDSEEIEEKFGFKVELKGDTMTEVNKINNMYKK